MKSPSGYCGSACTSALQLKCHCETFFLQVNHICSASSGTVQKLCMSLCHSCILYMSDDFCKQPGLPTRYVLNVHSHKTFIEIKHISLHAASACVSDSVRLHIEVHLYVCILYVFAPTYVQIHSHAYVHRNIDPKSSETTMKSAL
jgi:hypothetical protein